MSPSLLLAFFSLLLSEFTIAVQLDNPLVTRGGQRYACKCYEGDKCWPKAKQWQKLNTAVEGTLRRVIPAAAVCHETFEGLLTFDAEACSRVVAGQTSESWWVDQTMDTMWTYWSNNTCVAPAQQGSTCTQGFSPDYVIMATKKEHLKAGVDFARERNIRLLIRNTGHDFMGRSNALGALAINTHSFKDVTFVSEYSGPGDWTGGAVTIGAGVQLRELYTLASRQEPPVLVMGGECPTVGIAGGYIQGGGHGPMGTFYGMAADSALSFDVITAEGEYVTANADENPDLFWALKGGGPATYGVITSVSLKTYPEIRAAGTILNINSTHTNDTALIWKAVEIFHNRANYYTDHGMFVYYEILGPSLHVRPFVAPGMDAAGLQQALKPLFDELDSASIPYDTVTKEFQTFYDLYIDLFEDEAPNQNSYIGGRIFTRADIAERGSEIVESYKIATNPSPEYFGGIIGHIVGPGHNVTVADNAINPVWRKASSFSISILGLPLNLTWEERLAAEDIVTNVVGEAMRKASPDSGAYVNEGDLHEPNWQTAYWGENYPRLLETRRKWDPKGVFYAQATPGTEEWEVIEYNTRLCKKI